MSSARLQQKRRAVLRSQSSATKHTYFQAVAEARYVLRKVFRIVEEQARTAGIDPLAHQALIQMYGSAEMRLRVRDVADRLDISPAFASNLVKALVQKGFAARARDGTDRRATTVTVTTAGIKLLHAIDEAVDFHVGYFTRQLSPEQKDLAVYILMFYVGLKP